MDKTALYFFNLGRGDGMQSLETFKTHLATVVQHYPPVNMLRQFWLASRAVSRNPSLNHASGARMTRDANNFFYKEVKRLEDFIDDPTMSIQDLEKLLNTYVRVQTVPLPSTMARLIQKTKEKMPRATSECLEKLSIQFVELGVYPGDEWVETWWAACRPHLDKWSLDDKYGALYRLALLDYLRHDNPHRDKTIVSPCKRIADGFLSFVEKFADHLFANEVIKGKVFYAAKWFDYKFIDGYTIEKETACSSHMESTFAQAFANSNIIVNPDGIFVPQTDHKIDYELKNGKSYGSEFDGVSHFNRVLMEDTTEIAIAYNTSTRFHSWLNATLLPELHILRVPYFHWNGGERNLPWEKTLSKLKAKHPGVYAYHGETSVKNIQEPNCCVFKGRNL